MQQRNDRAKRTVAPVNTANDYLLFKAMELERTRDKMMDSYRLSQNPRTLDQIRNISEECNKLWKSVKLKELMKFYT